MEAFCSYLEQSRNRLDKVKTLFQSLPTPFCERFRSERLSLSLPGGRRHRGA